MIKDTCYHEFRQVRDRVVSTSWIFYCVKCLEVRKVPSDQRKRA